MCCPPLARLFVTVTGILVLRGSQLMGLSAATPVAFGGGSLVLLCVSGYAHFYGLREIMGDEVKAYLKVC